VKFWKTLILLFGVAGVLLTSSLFRSPPTIKLSVHGFRPDTFGTYMATVSVTNVSRRAVYYVAVQDDGPDYIPSYFLDNAWTNRAMPGATCGMWLLSQELSRRRVVLGQGECFSFPVRQLNFNAPCKIQMRYYTTNGTNSLTRLFPSWLIDRLPSFEGTWLAESAAFENRR